MAVYNESRYIASAIASILTSKPPVELEIIIVDDGSTDKTVEIIQKLAEERACIRLVCQENQGVVHARNRLLELIPADCDLVTFLDGDDVFVPGYLDRACQRMMDHPELKLMYSQMCMVESDQQDLGSAVTDDVTISRSISLSIGLYRPSLLKEIGPFDPSYLQAEDTDFLLRLFESNPPVYLSDEIAVYYRQHQGNMTKNTEVVRRYFSRAMLGHIKRRKANPDLAPIHHIFKVSQMSSELKKSRFG
jgi:glycosyltransferase involved in cell wall biosynthesis